MSVYSEETLAARFATLAPEPLPSDWLDVRRRARPSLTRRRIVAIAIAAALAVLVIGSALGARHVFRFFDAKPAPDRVVAQFEDARQSMRTHFDVEYPAVGGKLRTVFVYRFSDGSQGSISLAPTGGGFCSVIGDDEGGFSSAGCRGAEDLRAGPIALAPIPHLGKDLSGNTLGMHHFIGSVSDPDTARLVLRYEDGAQDDVPLTWVSKPIDAGFFAFDPAPEHYGVGHRATVLVALDGKGREIARWGDEGPIDPTTPDPWRVPAWTFPARRGMPPAIDPGTVHRLQVPSLPRWLTAEVGVSGAGGRCFRVSHGIAGGCRRPGTTFECCVEARSYGQKVMGERRLIVLLQGFMAEDAQLELSFEDGRTIVVPPREQVILYAIPPDAFRPGHRLMRGVIRKTGSGRVMKTILYNGQLTRPRAVGNAVLETVTQ